MVAGNGGAPTRLFPDKKDLQDLKVVYDFLPSNKYTIKPGWPIHCIKDVVDTVIKPQFHTYSMSDAANGYWAILIKQGDEYKTRVLTPNRQYIYLRIG